MSLICSSTVAPDLNVIVRSLGSAVADTTMTFRQLMSSLAPKLGLPTPSILFEKGVVPLNEEQERAVEQLAPLIENWSEKHNKKVSAPWHNTDIVNVYNCDQELDDQWRQGRLYRLLCEQQALTPEKELPESIVITAQRNGLAPETFDESAKACELAFGYKGERINSDEKVLRWGKHKVTLMDGATLRPTKKGEEGEGGRDGFTARDFEAAERLTKLLDGRRFNYHGNTCARLWQILPEEVKARCNDPSMTNAFFINKEGKLRMAANGNFDPSAFGSLHDGLHTYSHGSLFSHTAQTFNDIKAWPKVLKTKVVDPTFYRRQIGESMRLGTKWLCQIDANVRGKDEASYLPELMPRLSGLLDQGDTDTDMAWLSDDTKRKGETGLTKDEKSSLVEQYPWLVDALEQKTYNPKKTKDILEKRQEGLESKIVNPLDNSLADFLMTFADGPSPTNKYMPCRVDIKGISEKRDDISSIEIDLENPNANLPILGDESRLIEEFEPNITCAQELIEKRANETGTELYDIVDEPLARDLVTWYALQNETAKSILTHLENTSASSDDLERVKLRERMERIVSACDNGPMVQHARSVLSGTASGTASVTASEPSVPSTRSEEAASSE